MIAISYFGFFFVEVYLRDYMKKTKDYINLLPPEDKKPARTINYTVLLSCLFALVLIAFFGWQGVQLWELQSRSAALKMKKQALQEQLSQIYRRSWYRSACRDQPGKSMVDPEYFE